MTRSAQLDHNRLRDDPGYLRDRLFFQGREAHHEGGTAPTPPLAAPRPHLVAYPSGTLDFASLAPAAYRFVRAAPRSSRLATREPITAQRRQAHAPNRSAPGRALLESRTISLVSFDTPNLHEKVQPGTRIGKVQMIAGRRRR